VRIDGLALARRPDGWDLSAGVDGLKVWFRLLTDTRPAERVDPFVPAALLAAMAAGEPLDIAPETPVSTQLLQGIQRAQDILHAWNPELRKVPLRAAHAPAPAQRRDVATFFSCGVDSLYTAAKHGKEVSRLLLIQGLEISLRNTALFEQTCRAAAGFAQETGRTVVPVQTNLRQLADAHRLDIHLFHGPLLAGVALATGHQRTYIPSSWTYANLVPWGSHALLDTLWSTESCELVHDGAESPRTEKLATVAQSQAALRVLRVCPADAEVYNCGRCEKCLRTMVTLHLLGVRSETLPPLSSRAVLRRAQVDDGATDLQANIELAVRVGDRDVARALRACLRRYRMRKLIREADQVLLGGRVRRAYRWVRAAPPAPPLIGCVPRLE
jgi:hypothetical protein